MEIVSDGTQVLVPPDSGRRKGAGPGRDEGLLRSCAGCSPARTATRSIQRRGRTAALSEWRPVAATPNLLKLYSHWRNSRQVAIVAETG